VRGVIKIAGNTLHQANAAAFIAPAPSVSASRDYLQPTLAQQAAVALKNLQDAVT
jgi:hypothetical protein